MKEQFIQDAAADPKRLTRMAQELLNLPWTHDPEKDVVVVEYSFRGGRVDILGTFDRGQRALIVEVKQGYADASAVEQVVGYLDSAELRHGDLNNVTELAGAVIAEGFLPDAWPLADSRHVELVEFKMYPEAPKPGEFPFRLAVRTAGPAAEGPITDARQRTSSLATLAGRIATIKSDNQRHLCEGLAKAFQDGADPVSVQRRAWLRASVKKTHVSLRYRGEGILCFWVKDKTVLVGLVLAGNKWEYRGEVDRPANSIDALRTLVEERLREIDEATKGAIGDFRWGRE